MKRCTKLCCLIALAFGHLPVLAVTIDLVPIGNPGNPADTRYPDYSHPNGVGGVGYSFLMAKTEVTNAQYAAFLNAVAASDPYGLYSDLMGSDTFGGIVRSGSSGSYIYAVKPRALSGAYPYDNKPVVSVSFGDAMRFANWLHNGQPAGVEDASTTEAGAYTLNGATTYETLVTVTRNPSARWWLPSDDEWYKAAYYSPSTASYYDYPTGTNSVPNNNPPSSDTGNSVNFNHPDDAYPMTDAGAYTLSASPYGTFDQGGNVWEWNDTPINDGLTSYFGLRGGSWYYISDGLRASSLAPDIPTDENSNIGFRVASIPEPSTLALVGLAAAVALLGIRRGRCHHLRTCRRLFAAFVLIGIVHAQSPPVASAFTTTTVLVGNPGNPPDQNYSGQGQFGAVPYAYRMAVHEVTNSEYAAFLSDKASSSDPYQLYNPYMDADPRGGISSMSCDLFTCGSNGLGNPQWTVYYAKPNMGNKPVNYVSWVDAIRFVNYLNNGPGVYSSTETGAYTIGELDYAYQPLHPEAITRNPGATWVLPNENEWYKAAYYQPTNQGGDSDGYWLSPTRSNVTAAVLATADSVGNISNPGPNVINEAGASWNGQPENVTTVGSAGLLAASFYGTYDQGGNVVEWTESSASVNRVARGGGFGSASLIGFRADQRSAYPPDFENVALGFRVAQLIPISPGDLNGDGSVDAADYVVWRRGLGTPEQYSEWRANFGRIQIAGGGAALRSAEPLPTAVPEPATVMLLIFNAAGTLIIRNRLPV